MCAAWIFFCSPIELLHLLSCVPGLVADIDLESEIWRWMGSARFDLYVSCTKIPSISFQTLWCFIEITCAPFKALLIKLNWLIIKLHTCWAQKRLGSERARDMFIGCKLRFKKKNTLFIISYLTWVILFMFCFFPILIADKSGKGYEMFKSTG